MRTIKSKSGVEIKLYSSAKELSIVRYNELQKYLLLESGMGDSFEAIESRLMHIVAYIEEGKILDAKVDAENAIRACLSVKAGISYTSMAFACLVASIGGESLQDASDEGVSIVVEKIKQLGLTFQDISESVDEIKKKS